MITNKPFYHGIIRKATIAFGGLFSNIHVVTKNAGNTTEKIVKVPIAYANKEKYIVRLQQDPSMQEDVLITLPRLSFEITGFNYDAARQINKIHKLYGAENGKPTFNYAPVPYDIQFTLYSYTKTQEDNLQIMEQILPFFSPDLSLTVKMISSPEINQDIPLTLQGVSTDDQFDGNFEDRRYIITTYSFEMKLYLYSPILGSVDAENHFEGTPQNSIKKVFITYSNQNSKYSAVVDPEAANLGDNYTILENFDANFPNLP